MRDFYVYGFKNRTEFSASARTYDYEKRRIEGWLGDYMGFVMDDSGKNVFISVDTRSVSHNPLYRAWKTKSFTALDITLHFLILDVLHSPEIKKTFREILFEVYERLENVENYNLENDSLNESTLRKKLNEYVKEGIIVAEKTGKTIYFRRGDNIDASPMTDMLDFFSEAAPVGVVGSTLLDKTESHTGVFSFKHHYITSCMDSDVLSEIFDAIRNRRTVSGVYKVKNAEQGESVLLAPVKVLISAVNGRQYVIAYNICENEFKTCRIDFLSDIKQGKEFTDFERIAERFSETERFMWGVNCSMHTDNLKKVEFDVCVGENEEYIIRRLMREKRCGTVTRKNDGIYTFSAEVFDITELIPWIRSFVCRITRLEFSDKVLEKRFKDDLLEMYEMYEMYDGGKDDEQSNEEAGE